METLIRILERIAGLTPLGEWLLPILVSIIPIVILLVVLYFASKDREIKYRFITVGSHKLRTPLSRIKVAVSEIIEKRQAADRDGEPYVITDYDDRMLQQIALDNNRLIGLVNILLEVAESERNTKYSLEPFDIVRLMQEILTGYQSSQWRNDRIFLNFEASEKKLFVKADRRRISTVIRVLLENAIMYSPAGGKITISIIKQSGNKLVVSVADEGMGILGSEQRFIFTKFYRSDRALHTNTEGTGIGLFLSKRIIEGHGGKMWFKSEGEYKGSTFFFTIASVPAPPLEKEV